MSGSGDGSQKPQRTPEKDPILNNPYGQPKEYWQLDGRGRATGKLVSGRRPSAPYPTVPRTGGHVEPPTEFEKAMHRRINRIRKCVGEWRKAGYPGIGRDVSRLLE